MKKAIGLAVLLWLGCGLLGSVIGYCIEYNPWNSIQLGQWTLDLIAMSLILPMGIATGRRLRRTQPLVISRTVLTLSGVVALFIWQYYRTSQFALNNTGNWLEQYHVYDTLTTGHYEPTLFGYVVLFTFLSGETVLYLLISIFTVLVCASYPAKKTVH